MATEQAQAADQEEYVESLRNMSLTELNAMKGDNAEEDALIDRVIAEGNVITSEPKDKAMSAGNPDNKGAKAPTFDAATGKEIPPGDDDDDDDVDPPAAAAAAAKPAEAAAPNAEAEAAAAAASAAAASAEAAAAAPVEVPKLNLGFVDAKYSKELTALSNEKAGKFQELMDGTMDAATYSAFETDYEARRDVLREQKVEEKQWFTHVHAFKAEQASTIGLNYYTNQEAAAALDDWTIRIASKPENAAKDPEWCLAEAHKKVMVELDIKPVTGKAAVAAAPAAAPGAASAAAPAGAAKAGRAPDLSGIPPTLGGLPIAATETSEEAGEFAGLASLTGMDYERALAALTPAQKDRYERT